jgi:hypothetical protein
MQKSALSLRIIALVFSFFSGGYSFGQGLMGSGSESALSITNRPLPPLNNTKLGTISYYDITQELLDSLRSRYRLQKTPYYKVKMSIGQFSRSGLVRQQVYLKFGDQKRKDKIFSQKRKLTKGKLIAADSNGVYLYRKSVKKLGFVPYNDIWYIRRGNTLEDKLIRDGSVGAVAGAIITFVIVNYEIEEPVAGLILAPIGAVLGAGFVLNWTAIPEVVIHELQNTSKKVKFRINYRQDNMQDYIAMVNKDRYRYGKRLLYSEFPGGSVTNEINEPLPTINDPLPTTPDPVPPTNDPLPTTPDPVPPTNDPLPTTPDPLPTTNDPLPFKTGKYISAAWMIQGFESKFVNVQRMLKTFPDLRNSQLTEADKALFKNLDEVKYAAMLICTPLGFDFSKAVELNESQATDLSQLLPYFNVQIVNAQTVIKSNGMTRIDEVNLEFLYKLMK